MPTTTLLDAATANLGDLLANGKTYHVPAYQRDYSHDSDVYRLGNLTLLEPVTNRALGNADYATKVAAYRHSSYALTKSIDYPEWTPQQIRSRQRELARVAKSVWRLAELG